MAPASVLPRIAGYNLLVSSLRGSPIPLYMGGASVTAMYPMSIIVPGGGLNVTCISYNDQIDFGLTLEPSVFPDPWNIISGLEQSLSEYLALLP
jgi:diacylglycerol O-acyltransferase